MPIPDQINGFRDLNEKGLSDLNIKRGLSLNIEELQMIQKYYSKIKRDPSTIELEVFAQTWSEHCRHKIFNSSFEYTENGKTIFFKNLFKETIVRSVKDYKGDILISVFKDNAGIIKYEKDYGVAFKVETHNHPSAIAPYGGAGTGVGGVIRDIIGCGLGADPVACTDILCFAEPATKQEHVPAGIMHPKRIMTGVVDGIRDYGNRMGIPIINGAVHFDKRYIANPLVYCGTAGIIPVSKTKKKVKDGDLIVLIGGRTGRDGIGGATFSSRELTESSEEGSINSVQIGNPVTEKMMLDVLIPARDKNLYDAITDCGAGGLSSAVGEMAEEVGAVVELDKVPMKEKGMSAWEIFLSESQERMVVSSKPGKAEKLIELCNAESVEASIIGKFENTGRLVVKHANKTYCDVDLEMLHQNVPKRLIKAEWKDKYKKHSPIKLKSNNLTSELKKLISSYNIRSKEVIVRQYDFEVQGNTVLKPFQGNDGLGDGAVVIPPGFKKGISISNGINTRYADLDAYWMAASAIEEALRNIACTGCSIKTVALLDNFCWGESHSAESMGSFVRSAMACRDMAKEFNVPFISGKDSFYNEYKSEGKHISIPHTLLISAIGITKKQNITSFEFKKPGNLIYILGKTYNELGGSEYFSLKNVIGGKVPRVRSKDSKKTMSILHKAIAKKYIISAHDCSDGGMAPAVLEMAMAGNHGAEINISKMPSKNVKENYQALFSESNGRFIVEVNKKFKKDFEKMINKIYYGYLGKITKDNNFIIRGRKKSKIINCKIQEMKKAWRTGF